MKQKKIGDILYVFDQTPYVITQDTDAEVIKIQLEAVDGFKAINNSTINAKIEGYNYFLFTVHKQEWADYVDNYTVTVASTTNGTCTVDKTDADPGEEITIAVTPAAGYELDTLTVTAGGESVTVTNNKFTMPAANVTVTATFAEILYNITIAAASNGTVTTSPASSAAPGAEVTITTTPAAGYELDTLTVMAGETPVTVTNSKFTMPAANVTVTATFAQSVATFNGKFYDTGNEITQPWSLNMSDSSSKFFELLDKTNPTTGVYAATAEQASAVSWAPCIVATFESSDTSVLTIESQSWAPQQTVYLQGTGTANIIVTWPAQTVEDPSTHEETYYAGGSQTLQVIVSE